MEQKYEKAKALLTKHKQEHLLNSYESLGEKEKERLLDQILRYRL